MENSKKISTYTRTNGVVVYTLEMNGKPLKSSTDANQIMNLLITKDDDYLNYLEEKENSERLYRMQD
tara:strand:+ start:37 stop:237 length:201 start_codon:yes stop_codon:yes gene_type:complete